MARRFCDRTQPGLEAQLCNLADEIAYNAHDIDDGVRSGLISIEQLSEVDLFDRYRREALAEHPQLQGRRVLYETIRRMLSAQVYDVIDATRAALEAAAPADADAARARRRRWCSSATRCARNRPSSSASCFATCTGIRSVMQTTEQAQDVVRELFAAYLGASRRDAGRLCAARGPAARGGGLHRRHDRSLRDARTRAPHRAAVDRR